MAISKIKINGTEHELETTIANVSGLQDVLDNKANDSDKADSVKTASGEAVSLSNSVHTPLYGFKLYGKTTQDGTPTPEAPVELVSAGEDGSVEVNVCGKNLWRLGDNVTFTTWIRRTPVYLPKGTYCFSAIVTSDYESANSCGVYFYDINESAISSIIQIKKSVNGERNSFIVTFSKDVYYITLYAANNYVEGYSATFNSIQIELSDTASDYEPYKTPETITVSTPNGLAGVPVASGGNYTDNNGQQWICDEVDFGRGVYVQRVKQFNLAIADMNNADTHAGWSGLDITDCVETNTYFKHGSGMLNNIGKTTSINYSSGLVFFGSVSNGELSQTEWKELHPDLVFVMLIPLITPIETPLSAEQLQAYASLHTNEPNTTIINDGNAGMEVKYYTPSTAVQMVHSPSDEGKILSIDEHGCVVLSENNSVPVSTADDDGKFLRVVNGVAAWAIVPNAEEATF